MHLRGPGFFPNFHGDGQADGLGHARHNTPSQAGGLVVLQGGLGFRVARRFGIAIDLVLVCCFLAGLLLVVIVVERQWS